MRWKFEEILIADYKSDFFTNNLKNNYTDRFSQKIRLIVNHTRVKDFSSRDVEKRFHIREFLNTYKIFNQEIKEIKQIFIDIIHIFEQYQLIGEEDLLILNRS